MKKSLFITVVSGIFVLTLFCFGSFAAKEGPIKIGWLVPLTGSYAGMGEDVTNGFEMYMDEIGWKVAGRKIKLIKEDSRALPDVGIPKFRKLVQHDRVAALGAPMSSPMGLAAAALADQLEIPLLISSSAADDNTQRRPSKWASRLGWSASQPNFPFGEWVRKNLGYEKVSVIAIDFQFGYDNVGGFQTTFEANGGKVIQKLWVPFGVVDFGPYISAISRNADAVYVNLGGHQPIKFHKQYRDSGLKLPLIGGMVESDEFILPLMGDEILGFISAATYSAALTTPGNKKWQKKYQAKYKKEGSLYAMLGNDIGYWLHMGIEEVNGDVENKEAFLKAIKKTRVPEDISIRGPYHMDEYGNPVQNVYIRKVEKADGYELDFMKSGPMKWNMIIDTIPKVSQFWKFDPKEYLKQPTFSHSFPPCKYCE